MKLRAYMQLSGISAYALARKIKVSHSTILRLVSGETRPTFDTMQRLFVATDGAVTPNDFLNAKGDTL